MEVCDIVSYLVFVYGLVCSVHIEWQFVIGCFSLVSRLSIDGICVVGLVPATKTISGVTFHPLVVMLIFCSFSIKGFCNKIITVIREFYGLYCEFMCRGF